MTIIENHITSLGLDVRSTNALLIARNYVEKNGKREWVKCPIDTVKKLISLKEYELLRVPNLGRKSLTHIKKQLEIHGLTLNGNIKPYFFAKDMELRDYFAAKAMQLTYTFWMQDYYKLGFDAGDDESDKTYSKSLIAETAYEMADAMLKARKEQL